mmetsp:Transcript_24593/g.59188  ORF Transcript_24593/g.59188 Transcript_24593/m.59188 type:complete len:331 (-) Transcript_24593:68-1060(-)
MKAVVVTEFGGPSKLTLATKEIPVPGTGQIVVKVYACGVNPVETYIRSGTYRRKPSLPYTPGSEASGIVHSVGSDVKDYKVGDRVWQTGSLSGTYAQYNLCDVKQHVHCLPDNVPFAKGVVSTAFRTAYRALFQRAQAKPNQTVFIHGASGGVGLAATQLAISQGMKVIGTAGTEQGLKLVKKQGCTEVINHRMEDRKKYTDAVLTATGGGPDIILEMLANKNLNFDMQIIGKGGRIVVIGNRGTIDNVNPRLLMGKEAMVIGVSLPGPAHEQEAIAAIQAGLSTGALNPVVGPVFKLEDASKAHVEVIEHKAGTSGKIVILPFGPQPET